MLELDVRRTRDGSIIVFHDTTTERWNSRRCPVHTCTLADMRQLDMNGERVPTLAEVCAFAHKSGIALNVELKQPDIARETVAVLLAYDLCKTTIVSSFYEPALRSLLYSTPGIRRGYLMGLRTIRPTIRLHEVWPFFHLRRVQATSWHPYANLPLLPVLLPLVQRAGYQVYIWTVDEPRAMREWAKRGVTGIITNRPDVGRAVFPHMHTAGGTTTHPPHVTATGACG